MRHRKSGVKLNRTSSHRDAMFRNMVTSLFKHERIRTTDAKAKELRRWADHLVTLAKRGDLHARRQALSIVREKAVVHKLFEEVQEKFGSRKGGYTRVIKLGHRPGDAAKVSMIELVLEETAAKKKKAAPKPKVTPVVAPTSADAEKEAEAAPMAETVESDAEAVEAAPGEADASAEAEKTSVEAGASPETDTGEEAVEAQSAEEGAAAPADSAAASDEAQTPEADTEKKEE
jgi:large subunit ribosomal protein L17